MRGIVRALVMVGAGLRGSALLAEDAFDGQHMLKACGDYLAASRDAAPGGVAGSFESGRCAGFVHGAVAAHALDLAVARARTGHASSRICIPESTRLTDEVRAFHAYLKANASKLDHPGIDLLYAALLDAWPCAEKPEH
ncbi:MAG TPA: Rap1a/Tai family immunity protein [Thermoanaerobaculia bacterium]|nr:Rap1a/Tai family immunity protein [Thermoanaerobaculia bacterium]